MQQQAVTNTQASGSRDNTPVPTRRSYGRWTSEEELTLINYLAGENNDGEIMRKFQGKSEDANGNKRTKSDTTKLTIASACAKHLKEQGYSPRDAVSVKNKVAALLNKYQEACDRLNITGGGIDRNEKLKTTNIKGTTTSL